MKKYVIAVATVTLFACLIVPFETTLVPAWRVQIVDENGNKYRDHVVRQFCYDYTLDLSPCSAKDDSYKLTDQHGFVEFPERTVRASMVNRIYATATSAFLTLAHGSVGQHVYIDSSGPAGYRTLEYTPANGDPSNTLVLPSLSN